MNAAHLHHGWDLYNRFGKTKRALQRAALTIGELLFSFFIQGIEIGSFSINIYDFVWLV